MRKEIAEGEILVDCDGDEIQVIRVGETSIGY